MIHDVLKELRIAAKKWKPCSCEAHILADSSYKGTRLTTLYLSFPRFILPEFNKHRMMASSAASSRAIPFKRRLRIVWSDPAMPAEWGKEKTGMQSDGALPRWKQTLCRWTWRYAAKMACMCAWLMDKAGLHKQVTNRLLEPFVFINVIATSTHWDHFLALRCSDAADPTMRLLAFCVREALRCNTRELTEGEWHIPCVNHDDKFGEGSLPAEVKLQVAAARCARVTYDKISTDARSDIDLATKLQRMGHMVPFEHCAMALPSSVIEKYNGVRRTSKDGFCGCYETVWAQHRRILEHNMHVSNLIDDVNAVICKKYTEEQKGKEY